MVCSLSWSGDDGHVRGALIRLDLVRRHLLQDIYVTALEACEPSCRVGNDPVDDLVNLGRTLVRVPGSSPCVVRVLHERDMVSLYPLRQHERPSPNYLVTRCSVVVESIRLERVRTHHRPIQVR